MLHDVARIREDEKTVTFIWKRIDNVKYVFLGMNEYSCFEAITKTNNNSITIQKDLINKYYDFKAYI